MDGVAALRVQTDVSRPGRSWQVVIPPLVTGAGAGAKGGAGGAMPQEHRNTLFSRAVVQVVDLLSEGPIVGLVDGFKSVYHNETPSENADGSRNVDNVGVDMRFGLPDQEPLTGIRGTEEIEGVNILLSHDTPLVRSITDPDTTLVQVVIRLPALSHIDTEESGDLKGSFVTIGIELQDGVGSYRRIITDTIFGKTTSPYERGYLIPLTGEGPYNVKLVRDTPDRDFASAEDDVFWAYYTEIVEGLFIYPNTAYAYQEADAETFGGQIPRRGYLIDGIICRIPSNYDPIAATYDGVWDGTFVFGWTDNPAWVLYDMIVNRRYGVGQFMDASLVDKWYLYACSQYNDELVPDGSGGMERRFRFNGVLSSQIDAMQALTLVASAMRAMVFWANGVLKVVQDRPVDSTVLVTNENVIGGIFDYPGSDERQRHNACIVRWNDPEQGYKAVPLMYEDGPDIRDRGRKPVTIAGTGITSRGQAYRLAKWMVETELRQDATVVYQASLDHMIRDGTGVMPGDVVEIADRMWAQARMGGRLLASTTTTATLDAAIDFDDAETYQIKVMLPDGSVETRPLIIDLPGVQADVHWEEELSDEPMPGAVFIVVASNLAPRPFRVVHVVESEPNIVEITALIHDPTKFDRVEQDVLLSPPPYTLPNPTTGAPDPPTDMTTSEWLYLNGVTALSAVTVSWTPPADTRVAFFEVDWRVSDSDQWNRLPNTTAVSVDIKDTHVGLHDFRVRAVSNMAYRSAYLELTNVMLVGKSAPPADVEGFEVTVASLGIEMKWTAVPDIDIDYYEIRVGTDWDASDPVADLVAQVKGNGFIWPVRAAGVYDLMVKARDTSGGYSDAPDVATATITPPIIDSVSHAVAGPNVTLTWEPIQGSFAFDEYEISYGDDYAMSSIIARIKGTAYTLKAEWSGVRTFWVRGFDVAGNGSTEADHDVLVVDPGIVATLTGEVVDNNVFLRWTPPSTGTLPIESYEIRKGATFAGATVIGRIASTFFPYFETNGGVYVYWVVPIDTAGNMGTERSITSSVDQPADFVLRADEPLDLASPDDSDNTVYDEGVMVVPVNDTETWADHFANNSWSTIADQITAGFPIYIQPVPSTGFYEEVFDYGAVIGGSRISVHVTDTAVGGQPQAPYVIDLSVSDDGIAWNDFLGQSSIFATNFRYAKVHIEWTSAGGDDLDAVSNIQITVDVRNRTDSGNGAALAADSGGTTVLFNIDFIDVDSITVTAAGTTPLFAAYDFTDVPNPTSFKVLLYDAAGTRQNGNFSWIARGY